MSPKDPSLAPWTVTAERTVLQDRWIHVTAEDCVTDTGASIAPFYVFDYPDFAHAAAITPEGRLVMVRQYRHGARQPSLEFAGGMVEPGETAEAAAARELLEEAGYAGEVEGLVGSVWSNPVSHRNRAHTVLITGARRVAEPSPDPGERLVVVVVEWADLSAKVAAGEMIHPLHLAALLQLSLRTGRALSPFPAATSTS